MEEVVQCQAYRYFPGERGNPRVFRALNIRRNGIVGDGKTSRADTRAFQRSYRSFSLFFFRLFRLKENTAS